MVTNKTLSLTWYSTFLQQTDDSRRPPTVENDDSAQRERNRPNSMFIACG